MGVFESQDYMGAEVSAKSLQRCKRDYETEIKRIRDARQSAAEFRDAIYRYVNENGASHNAKPVTLGELIGRLELEVRAGDKIIANLIAEQEREKE